jgi:hypothetical protein
MAVVAQVGQDGLVHDVGLQLVREQIVQGDQLAVAPYLLMR